MEFLNQSAFVAASVVLIVQQILKLKVVPLAFANRYPVPTNIILSIVVSFFLVPMQWSFDNIGHLFIQVGTVAVTAAIAFNQLLSRWDELRGIEGEK